MKKHIALFLIYLLITFAMIGCEDISDIYSAQPCDPSQSIEKKDDVMELGDLIPIPDKIFWSFGDDTYTLDHHEKIAEIYNLAKPCISKSQGYIALDYEPDIPDADKNGKLEYVYENEQSIKWQSPAGDHVDKEYSNVTMYVDLSGDSVLLLKGAIGGFEFSEELLNYCHSLQNSTD